MLKRIAIVAFFTGTGQLLSIFVLKHISKHSTYAQLQSIAEIDSLVFFILNIVALGLQPTAIRNLAQTEQWKQEYNETQSARVTLGLLLMAVAAFAPLNQFYLIFLITPVFAWSGDYALYARGYPVAGSIVAFLRLAIPYSAVLAAAYYYPLNLAWVYAISLLLVYFITNAYISYFLGTAYLFKPSLKKLSLYISSLSLGIVALALYFLGLGLLLIIPYFYHVPQVVAVAFLGLKFYLIFKGMLRIIHQAFIKEMMRYEVCFKVDQLCGLAGLMFAAFTICFPQTFITLFFGRQYIADKTFFILLSAAGLVYSLFSSLTTKAMLERRDKPYALTAAGAALLTIVLCIIFSYVWATAEGIALSLLIGEVVFATGMLYIMNRPVILQERMRFLLKNLPIAIIPLVAGYFFGDVMKPFIAAAVLAGLMLVWLYHNKFEFE